MQQRPLATRKRTASVVSPGVQQQQFSNMPYPATQDPASFDPSYVDWSSADGLNNLNQFVDSSGLDSGFYDAPLNGSSQFSGVNIPNSQLVRRSTNQQLVSRPQNPWVENTGGGAEDIEHMDEEEDLEQKALAAKKEAQAKRKQIPPFVQKLSSFLDNNTNSNLIRWSDMGDSFIVLDEDEFARKLIPELFKHNNYASFVRQLNMYGFHKKVGLSDNSMKASENKRKTPSEYYNKYFRRGRPELLWLIQKPKNPPTTKRKRDDKGQGDSDDERRATPVPEFAPPASIAAASANKDLTVIPKTELNSLRQELAGLQKQQKMITQVIQQMKSQNDQFYRQATAFQEMHQRHENSINAILTFLATFYNRSLEGQNNNMNDMFNPSLPQGNVQSGNIVDIGDMGEEMQMPTTKRHRQPLLLLAPEVRMKTDAPIPSAATQTRSTLSPKSRNPPTVRPHQPTATTPTANAHSAPTPPVKVEVDSPSMVTDNNGMMSVINAANSAASPQVAGTGLDFDSALHHFQNSDGNTPLTQQQRNDMLSMMQANLSTAGGNANGNTALSQPPTPPLPSLHQISQHNDQLDLLQRLATEHGENVQSLRDRITSLSPSGFIPGLDNGSNPPPDFDLDDWFQPDPNTDGFGDIDFEGMQDGSNDQLGDDSLLNEPDSTANTGFLSENDTKFTGGTVESISSRGTSPNSVASPTELLRHAEEISSPRKRRRGN